MPEAKLLKVWDTWEDGIGFPVDDGQANGFAGPHTVATDSFYGLKGELRVAQEGNDTGVTPGSRPGWGFVVDNPSSGKNVYLLGNDSPILTKVRVHDSSNLPAFTDNGDITYSGETLGQPAQYQGNWFFTDVDTTTSVIRELVTSVNGTLSSDTITDGSASSGGGHLGIIGHQLAKFNGANGVSILTTGDSPRTGTWGSYFPVGDSSGTASGLGSLSGLTFALRDDGLYTFNERGQSSLVYRFDYTAGDTTPNAHAITYWKGGVVYLSNGSLYYYTPGSNPTDIGLTARRAFTQQTIAPINKLFFDSDLIFQSVRGVGDYLYVHFSVGSSAGFLVGRLQGDDFVNIQWNQSVSLGSLTSGSPCIPVFSYAGIGNDLILYYNDSTGKLQYQLIHPSGSPFINDTRQSTSVVITAASAEVYLSELRFPSGVKPTELVVFPINLHATAPDYFQMSAFVNDNTAINIGPRITRNEPAHIQLPRSLQSQVAYSIMLGVTFTTGSSAARARTPGIARIELWGEEV